MARGSDRFFLFALADRLHMPVRDVERLSLRELEEWKAYISLEAERRDLAEQQAKHDAKMSRARGRR